MTLGAKMDLVISGLASLTERVDGLDSKLVVLDEKVGVLDTKVGVLDSKVEALDVKIEVLDTKVGAVDEKVISLDSKTAQGFQKLTNEIESLAGLVGRESVRVSKKLQGIGHTMKTKMATKDDLKNLGKDMQQDIDGLVKSFRTDFDSHATRIKKLEIKVFPISKPNFGPAH